MFVEEVMMNEEEQVLLDDKAFRTSIVACAASFCLARLIALITAARSTSR